MHFKQISVVDFREYIPEKNDIFVLFIANNEHHHFVQHILLTHRHNKIISIIHDLSIFMSSEQVLLSPEYDVEEKYLCDVTKFEVQGFQTSILEDLQRTEIRDYLKYVLMGQSLVLERSSVIVTHSHYAALRLVCEHKLNFSVPILVMQLPSPPEPQPLPMRSKTGRFTIGVFGWVQVTKRPIQIVEGFQGLIETLPKNEKTIPQLKFVGQIADESFNPVAIAKKLGLGKQVICTGYLPLDLFKSELLSCDCFMNLRFPSCGESSATLNELSSLNRPFAVSNYQAFKEEKANKHISIDADTEVPEICDFLFETYLNWKNGKGVSAPRTEFSKLPPKFSSNEALNIAIASLPKA